MPCEKMSVWKRKSRENVQTEDTCMSNIMSWTALEMEHMLHETNDREACRQCDQRSVRGRLKNKKASFVDLILISHHYYHFVIQMSFTVTDHHHSSTLSLSTYVFHNSFPPKTVFVSPD